MNMSAKASLHRQAGVKKGVLHQWLWWVWCILFEVFLKFFSCYDINIDRELQWKSSDLFGADLQEEKRSIYLAYPEICNKKKSSLFSAVYSYKAFFFYVLFCDMVLLRNGDGHLSPQWRPRSETHHPLGLSYCITIWNWVFLNSRIWLTLRVVVVFWKEEDWGPAAKRKTSDATLRWCDDKRCSKASQMTPIYFFIFFSEKED